MNLSLRCEDRRLKPDAVLRTGAGDSVTDCDIRTNLNFAKRYRSRRGWRPRQHHSFAEVTARQDGYATFGNLKWRAELQSRRFGNGFGFLLGFDHGLL